MWKKKDSSDLMLCPWVKSVVMPLYLAFFLPTDTFARVNCYLLPSMSEPTYDRCRCQRARVARRQDRSRNARVWQISCTWMALLSLILYYRLVVSLLLILDAAASPRALVSPTFTYQHHFTYLISPNNPAHARDRYCGSHIAHHSMEIIQSLA